MAEEVMDPDELRYSPESLKALDAIQGLVRKKLLALVRAKALEERQMVVFESDVRANAATAIQQVLKELTVDRPLVQPLPTQSAVQITAADVRRAVGELFKEGIVFGALERGMVVARLCDLLGLAKETPCP